MIGSYFKIAWRTLTRNKLYTSINVFGLSLGICSCLVIWLIAHYELSFDRFHPDQQRIFQINTLTQATKNDPILLTPGVLPPVPAEVRRSLPGLETVSSYHVLFDGKASVVKFGHGAVSFPSTPIITGPEYFAVMKYDWLAGNKETALSSPFKVVLSAKKAHQYFGPLPPEQLIGREIIYNDSLRVTLTGIVRDWQENTDFPYTEFISLGSAENGFLRQALQLDTWKGIPFSSRALVKLKEGIKVTAIQTSLSGLFRKNWQNKNMPEIVLQPLTSVHFAEYGSESGLQTARLSTLYTLSGIAVFILLLAVINYINLSTAQSLGRGKEMGMRKILGSSRANLVMQFLIETFLLTIVSVCLAILMIKPILNLFHDVIPPAIKFNPGDPSTVIFLTAVLLITSLTAGLYPARMLAHTPVINLREKGTPKGSEHWWLRKSLIVFQFIVSLIFIIGAVVVSKQISFMQHSGLGFKSDAVILFEPPEGSSLADVKLLAQKIRGLPGVSGVTRENMPPMGLDRGYFSIQYKARGEESMTVSAIKADENYLSVYGMKLLAGRNLLASDTVKEFVINENLAKSLGFRHPGQAVGAMLFSWGRDCPIVGVVSDFHQASFHEAITPLVITSARCTDMAVKLDMKGRSAHESAAILQRIKNQWKDIYPHAPFEYNFLDQSIAELYKKEQTTAWLTNIATGVTLFISCIGLFGLTTYSIRKRIKEIGIRKVLGARMTDILIMLSRDFLRLLTLAFVAAVPVAWFFAHRWLEDFVYRISISWWIFGLAGFSMTFIALITISFHAVNAAMANPVKSLRTE